MAIVFHYDASKNPGSEEFPAALPGVPLRDITEEEFESFPEFLQNDIAAAPMYRESSRRAAARRAAAAKNEETQAQ